MKARLFQILIFGCLFFMSQAAAAQIALVDDDVGHALLFKHQGNCYAVLPEHVARQNRFTIAGALSIGSGSGQVFVRDVEGDIALAVVEGQILNACVEDFAALSGDITDILLQQPRTIIERLGISGRIHDRTDAIIIENTQHHITVRTTNDFALGDVQQGSSGSILKTNGRVLGLALRAPQTDQAVFLRMDVISDWISAVFSGNFVPAPAPLDGPREDGSKGFRISGWQASSQISNSSISSLERGLLNDPYIVPWQREPISLEITLASDGPIPFKQLTMTSDTQISAQHTAPKSIHVEVDIGKPGSEFWRSLGARDMTATGKLTFSTGGIFARRVRLTIQSVWQADKDLRIDGLVIE